MNSFQSILEEHNVEYRSVGQHEHSREGWIQIDCPWCTPGTQRFRLGYSVNGGYLNCWQCGGKSVKAVLFELLTSLPWHERQIILDNLDKAPRRVQESLRPEGRLRIPPDVEALSRLHKSYLLGRLFDPDELAKLWDLRGIRISARLSWRIWIPIYHQGEIVPWTTRAIGAKVSPRYMSASPDEERIHHKSILYGMDYVHHSVVVCEGPTDVWRIGPGAVATLGTSFTDSQVEQLSRIPIRVICFDSETTAQKRAGDLMSRLVGFPGETSIVEVESGRDVAEADKGEVDLLRKTYLE